jgi:hypothetical protein
MCYIVSCRDEVNPIPLTFKCIFYEDLQHQYPELLKKITACNLVFYIKYNKCYGSEFETNTRKFCSTYHLIYVKTGTK